MKTKKIVNKLILSFELYIFLSLAAVFCPAYAEYYLVYSLPESNQCIYCHRHHALHHRHHHRLIAHHKRHRKSGLYIYYPRVIKNTCNDIWTLDYCKCCRTSISNRWISPNYIVYSAQPGNVKVSYNPDMSTTDDNASIDPEMQIN